MRLCCSRTSPCCQSSSTRICWRHTCGYAPANVGHDPRALQAYQGHRNVQHTVRYTELRRIGSKISGWCDERVSPATRKTNPGGTPGMPERQEGPF
jgi:hypothetical protein